MRTLLKAVLFISLFFYLPLQSMAWGVLGHRIVGEIADRYLTSKTKKEIQKILGTESIAISSNWADFIKSDPAYKYLDTWHYVDFNENISYNTMLEVLQKDTGINAYTRINFLINNLKNKDLAQDKKQLYLRLLIHIVGDVHQPLHVARNTTGGGNSIKVSWFNQASNLHRVWDSELIEFQQLSYTEYTNAINFVSQEQKKTWQSQPITEWLFDSYTISEQLHNEIKDPTQKLSYDYNFHHIEILNTQLLKGGVHLAGLLNEIYYTK